MSVAILLYHGKYSQVCEDDRITPALSERLLHLKPSDVRRQSLLDSHEFSKISE